VKKSPFSDAANPGLGARVAHRLMVVIGIEPSDAWAPSGWAAKLILESPCFQSTM
jgi:hypothetical protein